jgi:hypothetical protein
MKGRAVGHNFERGPPKDHPCQVWFNLVQRFQRRRFKCESVKRQINVTITTKFFYWLKLARWFNDCYYVYLSQVTSHIFSNKLLWERTYLTGTLRKNRPMSQLIKNALFGMYCSILVFPFVPTRYLSADHSRRVL